MNPTDPEGASLITGIDRCAGILSGGGTVAVDDLGKIFARAGDDGAQAAQFLRIFKGAAPGDGEETCNLHGFTAQSLKFRTRCTTPVAHPGRTSEFVALSPTLI